MKPVAEPSPPLRGVRVLDLSRLLPGPYCSLILSELGAEVLKVEDTDAGDYLRALPPLRGDLGGAFYALNRGKRSLALDLKQPRGRELLLRLAADSQVVIESFRPGVLDRLGIGYQVLAGARADLVLCSITGYGQDGPLRLRAGHDINYLGLSGVLAVGGSAEGAPCLPGVQLADVAGGALWAAIRILAALHSGRGAHLDVSMTEGAMALLLPWLGEMAFGAPPLRRGQATLNGGAARYGVYATAEGRHLAIGSLEPKFWVALSRALGFTAEASDLLPEADRQQALREQLQTKLAAASRDEWTSALAATDACVEPVLGPEELAMHPQHRQRGCFFTLSDRERGPVEQLRLPLDGVPASEAAPRLGQHTDEVLAELGLGAEEIQLLRADGIVR